MMTMTMTTLALADASCFHTQLFSGPKIDRVKNQTFDSRVVGGLNLRGPRGTQIDEKSMPKRLQDKLRSPHTKPTNI